jgi:hypothetical protein
MRLDSSIIRPRRGRKPSHALQGEAESLERRKLLAVSLYLPSFPVEGASSAMTLPVALVGVPYS